MTLLSILMFTECFCLLIHSYPHIHILFKLIIFCRGGQFRRTGVTGGNIVVGVVLGVLSGKYIFEEPIKMYWAEKHAAEAAAAGAISSSDGRKED